MPRFSVLNLVAPRLNLRLPYCFASLLIVTALAMSASGQTVWIDFTSDFHNGGNGDPNGVSDWIDELNEATSNRGVPNFTAAERQTIQTIIVDEFIRIYAGTNLNFVTSQPSGQHDVVYLGATNTATNVLGSAPLDLGNRRISNYPATVPRIFTGNYGNHISTVVSREASVEGFANAIAGSAAHELGHSFGLLHHLVYSNEGISPENNNLVNTGGLQTVHIMNTGSTGNTIAIRQAGGRTLSPFSEVIMDISGGSRFFQRFSRFDNISLVDNPVMSDDSEQRGGDAGDTTDTAQALSFQMGTLSEKQISFVEADLDGGASDVDYFSFDVAVETTLSAHVSSDQLGIGNDEFDPTLTLLDASGNELAFADDTNWLRNNFVVDQSVPASSEDTTFTQDSALFNITLAPGTYFLKVAPAQIDIGQTASNGDFYWLVTSLDATEVVVVFGDVNRNGFVNFSDIAPFISLLSTGEFQAEADINGDGLVDFSDIAPFIGLLAS